MDGAAIYNSSLHLRERKWELHNLGPDCRHPDPCCFSCIPATTGLSWEKSTVQLAEVLKGVLFHAIIRTCETLMCTMPSQLYPMGVYTRLVHRKLYSLRGVQNHILPHDLYSFQKWNDKVTVLLTIKNNVLISEYTADCPADANKAHALMKFDCMQVRLYFWCFVHKDYRCVNIFCVTDPIGPAFGHWFWWIYAAVSFWLFCPLQSEHVSLFLGFHRSH